MEGSTDVPAGFGNMHHLFLEFFPAALCALRRVWMAMMLVLEASRLRKGSEVA